MEVKTHVAAANAISLIVFSPPNIKSLAVIVAGASLGGAICDLDVINSETHKFVDFLVLLVGLILIGIFVLNNYYNFGVINYIKSNIPIYEQIPLMLLFLGISFYGMHQPHRSFTHSIIGVISLSSIIYFLNYKIFIPFAIGMVSHICLDILNHRKVRLFYPSKDGFSLKLCYSNGYFNKVLFIICVVFISYKCLMVF